MGQASKQLFESAVAPHFSALYRAAYRLTGGRQDAEDLVQEVCFRAYAQIARVAALDSARAWLLRVQYRMFVDGVRRRNRSPLTALTAEQAESLVSEEPGPEQSAEAAYAQRQLQHAWLQLAKEQRALLALHAEGYALAELHEITGLDKTVLSARLHRARTRLANLIRANATNVALLRMEN
jgi:RNA polymerase sigma-70 factor (ECF subfamily)